MTEREIFEGALEHTDAEARRVYLEKACGGDAALRERVEALLASHDKDASRFMAASVPEQLRPRGNESPTQDFTPSDDREPVTVDLEVSAKKGANNPAYSFLGPPSGRGGIGTLGHYEVMQTLGRGAFGIVFKAFDERLHRYVAIKVLDPQLATTSPPRKRFLREARAAAAVKHENVVQVYAVEEQPLPYMVMEFVDGKSLQELMDGTGPLELPEILKLGRQIAAGLAAAHEKGLIHRDIKPGNILIESGVEKRVKITDFGLARAADDASLTRTGIISGTPMYMAPEQALGMQLDHRADLFSLGSVLYQMACGRPPFRASTTVAVLRRVADETPRPIQDILPSVPDWFCRIVEKLHAKRPEDRIQSAREVAELFASSPEEFSRSGKTASPNTDLQRSFPTVSRNMAIGGAVTALVLFLGFAELFGVTTFFKRVRSETAGEMIRPSQKENVPEKNGGETPSQTNEATPVAEEKGRVPADSLRREDISPVVLSTLGGGDPAKSPADLVSVFGEGRFRVSGIAARSPSFSPDSKTLAVSSENEVHLFDVQTGERRAVFTGFGTVFCTRFSPDGKLLAVSDIVVRVIDVASGIVLHTLPPPVHSNVTMLFFTPDGKHIISGAQLGSETAVWDVKTGELVRKMPPLLYGGGKGADGESIVLAREPDDERINVYSPETGRLLFAGPKWPKLRWPEEIVGTSISNDGKQLAFGSPTRVAVWDLEKLKADSDAKPLFEKETPAGWVCFENRSGRLWTDVYSTIGHGNESPRCWDPATGMQVASIELPPGEEEIWHALSPEDSLLYASPAYRTFARVYNTRTGKPLVDFHGHVREVLCIAYSPDGRWVASGGRDSTTRIWDVATGKEKHVFASNSGQIYDVAFNRDGSRVLARDGNGNISLWKTVEGTRVWTARPGDGDRQQARFSHDGRTIAVSNRKGGVDFLKASTGETIRTWQALHAGEATRVAFSPDGSQLATSGTDNRVVVTDFESGKNLHKFTARKTYIDAIEFSSDGKSLLSGSDEPESGIQIWNLETGEPEQLPSSYSIYSLSANGQLFASCGREHGVRLWNLADPKRKSILVTRLNAERPHRVAFSPEGRHIATANFDGTIHLYRLNGPNQRIEDWIATRSGPPAGLSEGEWLKRVAPLPPGNQFEAVCDRFRELNKDPDIWFYGGEIPDGKVRHISVRGFNVDDFSALRALRDLHTVNVFDTLAADKDLEYLKEAKGLRGFFGGRTWGTKRLTDGAAEYLRNFHELEDLSLWGCEFTDKGVEQISNLQYLKTLDLGRTKVTDAGIVHVAKLTGLTNLNLSIHALTNDGLRPLKALSRLRVLVLEGTQVSDAGLQELVELQLLHELRLPNMANLHGDGLVHLQQLPNLRMVGLSGDPITDDGLKHLGKCSKLEVIGLDNCPITDEGLVHLEGLKNLNRLNLNQSRVTAAGVEKMRKALPGCFVEWNGPPAN